MNEMKKVGFFEGITWREIGFAFLGVMMGMCIAMLFIRALGC